MHSCKSIADFSWKILLSNTDATIVDYSCHNKRYSNYMLWLLSVPAMQLNSQLPTASRGSETRQNPKPLLTGRLCQPGRTLVFKIRHLCANPFLVARPKINKILASTDQNYWPGEVPVWLWPDEWRNLKRNSFWFNNVHQRNLHWCFGLMFLKDLARPNF